MINFTVDAIPIRVKLNPTNTNIEAFTLNDLNFMCTPIDGFINLARVVLFGLLRLLILIF